MSTQAPSCIMATSGIRKKKSTMMKMMSMVRMMMT